MIKLLFIFILLVNVFQYTQSIDFPSNSKYGIFLNTTNQNDDIKSLTREYENMIKDLHNSNNNNIIEYEKSLKDIIKQLDKIQYPLNNHTTNELDWINFNNNNINVPKKSLNIAIVVSSFEGIYSTSGIGTLYSILADYLVSLGHQVTVIYTRDETTEKMSFYEWKQHLKLNRKIELVNLPPLSVPITNTPHIRKSYQVYHYLKNNPPFDVVHLHDFEGLGYYSLAAKKSGLFFSETKFITGIHGPSAWVIESNTKSSPALESELEVDYIERRSVEWSDVIWAPSTYMINWMIQHNWDFGRKSFNQDMYLMPFLPRTSSIDSKIEDDSSSSPIKELVFFGRLESRKGIVLFCDALDLLFTGDKKSVPKVSVTFLGRSSTINDQDSLVYLKGRASKWASYTKVSYLLDKSSGEAIQYLKEKSNRLAVIPSLEDNSPYTLYECLYDRIPFIASATPSILPLIKESDRDQVTFDTKSYQLLRTLLQTIKKGVIVARPTFTPTESTQAWSAFYPSIFAAAEKKQHSVIVSPSSSTTTTPLVSICITHYNRPHYLAQAIESIENQSYKNYEVILVDDGSNSTEAIDYLKKLEPQFRQKGWKIIRTPNRYLGAARNTAAKESSGVWLYFLDDDNYAYPDAIESYVKVALNTNADVVTAPHSIITSSAVPSKELITKQWVPLGPSIVVGVFRNCFGDANFFIKRKSFERIGGFTEEYGVGLEDHELLSKLAINGFKQSIVTEPLLYYRIHDLVNQMVFKTNTKMNQMRYIRPYSQLFQGDNKPLINLLARKVVSHAVAEQFCNITLSSVSPSTGPMTGGTTITISGSGFLDCSITRVQVGPGTCAGLTVLSARQMTCRTSPNQASTPLDVSVYTSNGGHFTLFSAFTYTALGAPVAQECALDPTGTSISCRFDPQTKKNAGSCASFFSADTTVTFGTNPTCQWSDGFTLTITLGTSSTISVGDAISIRAGSITSLGGEPNNQQTIELIGGEPVPPVASINAPSVVGPCNVVELDGSRSAGGGGRQLDFVWSVVSAPDHMKQLTQILSDAKGSKVVLPNNTLTIGSTYEFALKVTNWLGKSDKTSVTISKVFNDVITVNIFGPSQIRIPSIPISLEGVASANGCSGNQNSNFVYQWRVTPDLLVPVNLNGRSLFVPVNAWRSGENYTFTLSATAGDSTGEDTVNVSINKRNILAKISGGDRTFAKGEMITLDASSSVDPDNSEGSDSSITYSYKWVCTVSEQTVGNCPLESLSEPIISFNSSEWDAGKYVISVEVIPSDNIRRSGVAITWIQLTNFDFIDVTIDKSTIPDHIDPGAKLVLLSVLHNNPIPIERLSFLWSVLEGDLSIDQPYSTPVTGRNLAIKSGALAPNTLYTFQVVVEDKTTKVQGEATVSFRTEARPSGGKINCYTKKGGVMDKYTFDLGRSWAAATGISGYSFRYRTKDSNEEIPLCEKSVSNRLTTHLPPGELVIIGYVMSGTGVASSSTCDVVVEAPSHDQNEKVLDFVSNIIKSKDTNFFELGTSLKIANSVVEPPSGKALSSGQVAQKVASIKASALVTIEKLTKDLSRNDGVDKLLDQADYSTESSENVPLLTPDESPAPAASGSLVITSEGLTSVVDILVSTTEESSRLSPDYLRRSSKILRGITFHMIENPVYPRGIYGSVEVVSNIAKQLLNQIPHIDPKYRSTAGNVSFAIEECASNIASAVLYRQTAGEDATTISRNGVSITTYKHELEALHKKGGFMSGMDGEPIFSFKRGIFKNAVAGSNKTDEVSAKYVVLPGNTHYFAKHSLGKFAGNNVFSLEFTQQDGQKLNVSNLVEPIVIDAGKYSKSSEYKCVWWDEKKSDWSDKGCKTERDGETVLCKCNHLTQFALLQGIQHGSNLTRIFIIVGSVVGGVVAASALVAGVVIGVRRRKRRAAADNKDDKKDQPNKKKKIDPAAAKTNNKKDKSFGNENEEEYIYNEFKEVYEMAKQKEVQSLQKKNGICIPSPVSTLAAVSNQPTPVESSPSQYGPYIENHSQAASTIQKAWRKRTQSRSLEKELEVEQILDNIDELLADQTSDPFEANQYHYDADPNVDYDDISSSDDDDQNSGVQA
ncbi:IPT/TIG domain-containing protein [Cavenderia fasciculata]|uniref:IPT/TIG domain-containing protein n=1 Tax=Cavenderia fasciculata TaxID=261658 RepID=F4PT05_CACFS|nr:IPT/TIG domain-containing protein [Cavenderia fasciculata]EGG21581.1 IPT/TIG domain-containing protein [Cavenderia fasciculata]|eukprot:XP_004359431.1 IPT/TIG domain-containing protein [Cavenderia fasciculata]